MNIAELREGAEAGSCVSQTVLGSCYLYGIDAQIDYQEAFRLLSAAAEQGASRARANLARMCAEGLGTPRGLAKAIMLYTQAANAGEFLAQIELGRIYGRGIGVPPDPEAAKQWYLAAVAQSDQVDDCEELYEAKAYLSALNSDS